VVIRNLASGQSALGSTDLVINESQPEQLRLGRPALLIADRILCMKNAPSFFPPGLSRYQPAGARS